MWTDEARCGQMLQGRALRYSLHSPSRRADLAAACCLVMLCPVPIVGALVRGASLKDDAEL